MTRELRSHAEYDARQGGMTLSLMPLEFDSRQARRIEKGVNSPLQPREIPPQLPRAARLDSIVQHDKEPVGRVEPSLCRLVNVQPARQLLGMRLGIVNAATKALGQARQLEVKACGPKARFIGFIEVEIHRVVERVRLGAGVGMG